MAAHGAPRCLRRRGCLADFVDGDVGTLQARHADRPSVQSCSRVGEGLHLIARHRDVSDPLLWGGGHLPPPPSSSSSILLVVIVLVFAVATPVLLGRLEGVEVLAQLDDRLREGGVVNTLDELTLDLLDVLAG
eukprot:6772623-Pyramimonas_sp.AAC.1